MLTWISVRKPDTKPDFCQKIIFSKKNTKQTKNPVIHTNRDLLISDIFCGFRRPLNVQIRAGYHDAAFNSPKRFG